MEHDFGEQTGCVKSGLAVSSYISLGPQQVHLDLPHGQAMPLLPQAMVYPRACGFQPPASDTTPGLVFNTLGEHNLYPNPQAGFTKTNAICPFCQRDWDFSNEWPIQA